MCLLLQFYFSNLTGLICDVIFETWKMGSSSIQKEINNTPNQKRYLRNHNIILLNIYLSGFGLLQYFIDRTFTNTNWSEYQESIIPKWQELHSSIYVKNPEVLNYLSLNPLPDSFRGN